MVWVSSAFESLLFQNKGPNHTLVGGRPVDALTNSEIYQILTPLPPNRYFMIESLLAGGSRIPGIILQGPDTSDLAFAWWKNDLSSKLSSQIIYGKDTFWWSFLLLQALVNG